MHGTALYFLASAACYAVVGMTGGIVMSATGDFSLAPVHAHLNLVGWVTMAIFGIYYHLVPEAAETTLARVHFWTSTAGLWLLVPGIVMAVRGSDETLAKVGSVLTVAGMLIFVATVLRGRTARASALPAE
ncbi:hypothetical protein BV394_06690 [Brevirhabdus pacifica]|uniref:Uncharacterized protein n=1 Tax=Brevirhabdus pacifica TaxID=1267768 RepID=A0A1U7DHG9_9RHOB|nr:hypothetical protein [Brevirhabdus pacifica]APX89440.1 hypothetical protein BV394_06690 [Brevirhabdus pacifica]OWU76542.1 signal peptide protein [Loktanella sp. 22II-4b]PJJ85916.1 hypothetical protein CLV77_0448 [Brevirhabdus pacifica]